MVYAMKAGGIKNFIRALRLPFATASLLPFIAGSLLSEHGFGIVNFLLGFLAVLLTHLSANLINDYADSQSGLDWQDRNFYKFFGGSKLIQEGAFSARFYLNMAIFFAVLAAGAIFVLTLKLKNFYTIGFFIFIILLSWAYSKKPFQLSYRRFGEPIIFLLFGPALVIGGYFIQTHDFLNFKSFMMSLPFGFLTTAILFANEIPDFDEDKKAGKLTWVSITGPERAYMIYCLLIVFAFILVFLNIILGHLGKWAILCFPLIIIPIKAAGILKKYPADKIKLMESSKLTILLHTLVSVVLILNLLL